MIESMIGPVIDLLAKWVPDSSKRIELAHELATMADKHAQELALAQIEVNKAEAASPSLWKSGWRPAIGWICATAFVWHFVLQPLLLYFTALAGVVVTMPEFDMVSLLTVLGGMLGLGGMRSWEKAKGLTR